MMQNPQASAVIDCHSSMHMLQDEQSTKEKNYLLVTHRFIHDSLSSFFQTLLIHIILLLSHYPKCSDCR